MGTTNTPGDEDGLHCLELKRQYNIVSLSLQIFTDFRVHRDDVDETAAFGCNDNSWKKHQRHRGNLGGGIFAILS